MNKIVASLLIVGVPMALSISWFLFWVLRLRRAAREAKARQAKDQPPQ